MSMPNPPLVSNGMEKLGHEACHFIPGCTSTYQVDCTWVGGVFCLAPTDSDMEVAEDINNIEAYHTILKEWGRRLAKEGNPNGMIKIEVDLLLSTDYLANVRQVCCGEIEVALSERGLAAAAKRLHDVREKLNSREAQFPKRPQKGTLSALSAAEKLEQKRQEAAKAAESAVPRGGAKLVALPPPPPLKPNTPTPVATPQAQGRKTTIAALEDKSPSANSPAVQDTAPPPSSPSARPIVAGYAGSPKGAAPLGATTGLLSPRPPLSPTGLPGQIS